MPMDPPGQDRWGLKGKVVLITGASCGLGANLAVEFAYHGAKLCLHGRNQEGLDRTVQLITDLGVPRHHVTTVTAELTNDAEVPGVVDAANKAFGKIDILINNAGIVKTGDFYKTSVEDLDEAFAINARALFVMTKHALPWINGSRGNIVNISSFTAQRPVNDYMAYCLSKTAVDAFTKSLALEMGEAGVRVNSVNPAILRDTHLWLRPGLPLEKNPILGGFILKKICSMYPIQRPSESGEVVPAVLFLASDKMASFITGQNILIDGGKALTSFI